MKKLLFLLTLLLPLLAVGQDVTNGRFEQEGSKVRIYYDLSKQADITIYLSTDGGKTCEPTPLRSVSGDVGKQVPAGTNRCAVWDVLADRDKVQGDRICFMVSASAVGTQTVTVGNVTFTMIGVEGGTFTMGATSEQRRDAYGDEKPAHQVTLGDYCIGETEVTQALWREVMGSNPSHWKGDNLPVENVSWEDCQEFVRKLNARTGKRFRLPTEAEWEYAARGGSKSRGYKYSGSNNLGKVAWYDGNSGRQTHPVKTKHPNELGIYDMSGNVWEWCQDWYGSSYYSSSPQSNPTGANSGSYRVLRGGSWNDIARCCRVANRNGNTPGSAASTSASASPSPSDNRRSSECHDKLA